jgi:hypothetical protein
MRLGVRKFFGSDKMIVQAVMASAFQKVHVEAMVRTGQMRKP